MGMQINTNIGALNAYRNLSATQSNLDKSLEKLSSGLRINRAADDAAGLAISEGLRSQVGGLKVAARNAQDGISVVQTAEGALGEVHSILQRLRDLAVQAGNDSNNGEARTNIETEATQLVSELDRIASSTNFNGIKLLDGSAPTTLNFQVGANGDADSRIAVDLADVSSVTDALTTGRFTQAGAVTSAAVDGNWTVTQGSVVVTVAMGAAGTHDSVGDVASALNGNAGFNANFIANVNVDGDLEVSSRFSSTAVVVAGTGYAAGAVGTAGALDFSSHAGAQAAIGTIDGQIRDISTARAGLGAVQNRFESAINTINVATENLTASESRIRDTDMASEMVEFTRAQILSQAGVAMLAQAKSAPQSVLQLLQ